MTKWMLKQTPINIDELARQTGIPPVLARILALRGYRSANDINAFLHPESQEFADPFDFADMEQAIHYTKEAIKHNKKIAIFGDYDADGIMSTVILYHTLKSLDADLSYYIPKREGEGYGLKQTAIDQLKAQGVQLIITCDNGISAIEEVKYANEIGIEIIILDHHTVTVEEDSKADLLPEALAVVDSHRADCHYPFKFYCAAGVCYRFSQALYLSLGKDWQYLGQLCLPFATIATICDLVDLIGENRKLVKAGLATISISVNPGLKALIKATGLTDKQLDTYHVGFILGPAINASGRLDVADKAVELFLTNNTALAKRTASELVELNIKRRKMTDDGAKIAMQMIEDNQLQLNKIIVIHHPDFFESIVGIIAGKIKEKYHRPVIVIAGDDKIMRGSCRSIEAYNIFDGLNSCKELLTGFGGHPMAAGLAIKKENIAVFADRINELCKLEEEDLQAQFRIDAPLPPSQANLDLAKELNVLAPYGKGNPGPLFAHKKLSIEKISLLGKDQNVIRCLLKEDTGRISEMISFNLSVAIQTYIEENFDDTCWIELLAGKRKNTVWLDIVYSLGINEYNGNVSAQLQMIDFRPSNYEGI